MCENSDHYRARVGLAEWIFDGTQIWLDLSLVILLEVSNGIVIRSPLVVNDQAIGNGQGILSFAVLQDTNDFCSFNSKFLQNNTKEE